MDEPEPRLAVLRASMIGSIARSDYSKGWTDLFPTLVGNLQQGSRSVQHNVLVTLYYVVKALGLMKLPAHKNIFRRVTQELMPVLMGTYSSCIGTVLEGNTSAADAIETASLARYALKSIRWLLVEGIVDYDTDDRAQSFLGSLFQHTEKLIERSE